MYLLRLLVDEFDQARFAVSLRTRATLAALLLLTRTLGLLDWFARDSGRSHFDICLRLTLTLWLIAPWLLLGLRL